MVRAKLADPGLHWLSHLVRMTMAIIQERSLSFLLVARKLFQAIGGGAQHIQLAVGNCCLPRVPCKHSLDEFHSLFPLPIFFFSLRPSISGISHIFRRRI